jgi:hypothetical protein
MAQRTNDQFEGTEHTGGSEIVSALEAVYADIRGHHPELPAVVMITGSGLDSYGLRWGHFARDRWLDDLRNNRRPEMFVGGERLATGAELTLQTLIHESAHGLACVRGVQDCSRQNRYHNRRFLAIAEELGLVYDGEAPHPSIGFSAVVLADETRRRYADTIERLNEALTLHLDNPLLMLGGGTLPGGHGGRIGKTRRTRGTGGASTIKATCSCDPARAIRVSRTVLHGPAIRCDACGERFA